jgi:protoporphyrinogen oxidase
MPRRARFVSATRLKSKVETSLIERFLYPKFGPGQMWEEVARRVSARGGEIHLRHRVVANGTQGLEIVAVTVRDEVHRIGARRCPAIFSSPRCRFAI